MKSDDGARETGPQETAPQETDSPEPQQGVVWIQGAHLLAPQDLGVQDLVLQDGRIVAIGGLPDGVRPEDVTAVDLSGRFITPAFIDSHVHLAYWPVGQELLAGGVAAAVDMAAPEDTLGQSFGGLRVLSSGPMVTAEGGYPTQSWGSDGYGLECADAASAEAAVQRLADAGAGLIKLPITSGPTLDEGALRAAAARAADLQLHVASHAMGDAEASLAARVGVTVLAHTPTQALSQGTISSWSQGAVVGSLRAFGGSETTLQNLRGLRAAGATVLYGTDLGNTRTAGIDPDELRRMAQAGMSGQEILVAGTSAPAAWWGMQDLGRLELGRSASLLVLSEDPRLNTDALGAPVGVWIDGRQLN